MRHNFTAHSGVGFESVKVSLVLHPDINSNMEPMLYTELRQPDYHKELIEEMIIIVKALQEQSINKRSALSDKFLNETVRPKGKLYWYQKGTYDEFTPQETSPFND